MSSGAYIAMDPVMLRRARARAAELGISLSEYMRRLVSRDLGDTDTAAPGFAETGTTPKLRKPRKSKPDISRIFDLGASAKPTDIARDKDKLIGEAVWDNYLRKVGRAPRRRRR
jgi:hypothetical protein